MRHAGQKRIVPASAKSAAETAPGRSVRPVPAADFDNVSTATMEPTVEVIGLSPQKTFIGTDAKSLDGPTERQRYLEIAIRQRIESRLPGRVRNLVVRAVADTVLLEGHCATFYTKQLAQHAALGILDDEHLENAIAVGVVR